MARKRQTKAEFYDDLTMSEVDIQARFLYQGMWCFMDAQGLIEADARFIKSKVFPHDENLKSAQVQKWLDQLVAAKRLRLFSWQGKNLYFAPKFSIHQRIYKDEPRRFHVDDEFLKTLSDDTPTPPTHAQNTPGTCALEVEVEEEGISFEKESVREKTFKPDLEAAYQRYPRKEGKAGGFLVLGKTIKTEKDYADLITAIDKYATLVRNEGRERKHIKQFSSFVGTVEKQTWRDYIDLDPEASNPKENAALVDVDAEVAILLKAVSSFGRDQKYNARDWLGEERWQAVEFLGGWQVLCAMPPDEWRPKKIGKAIRETFSKVEVAS